MSHISNGSLGYPMDCSRTLSLSKASLTGLEGCAAGRGGLDGGVSAIMEALSRRILVKI